MKIDPLALNEAPIVVYNTETATPIYVFAGYAACAKLLFPKESKQAQTKRIRYAVMNKTRLKCEEINLTIAIRRAKEEFISKLGSKEYVKL